MLNLDMNMYTEVSQKQKVAEVAVVQFMMDSRGIMQKWKHSLTFENVNNKNRETNK